jgi:hypothetical protein
MEECKFEKENAFALHSALKNDYLKRQYSVLLHPN